MIALLDVNILLALAWHNHVHNAAAHRWFVQNSNNPWATCILTQSAFVRLSLNPPVIGATIDCATAITALRTLIAHPTHQYISDAPAIGGSPFDQLIARIVGHRQVTDAVLLHFARTHGLKLVTFDQGLANLCPWPSHLEICPIP